MEKIFKQQPAHILYNILFLFCVLYLLLDQRYTSRSIYTTERLHFYQISGLFQRKKIFNFISSTRYEEFSEVMTYG